MLESAHEGVLTDRLAVSESEDQLLNGALVLLSNTMQSHALVSYTGTGTRLGLELLSAQQVDASCLHWGPLDESHQRHHALLQNQPNHKNWVFVPAFKRERGIKIYPSHKMTSLSTE